ncbi:MAG: hypothetical protein HN982_06790 [Candidatus Marinimicrobia bacterium]|nr:hypothetical protein [Candidatus Neomarinimicrobiota bacterium]
MSKVILLLTLSVSSLAFCQTYSGDDTLKLGVQAMYNYEYDTAIHYTNLVKDHYPDNPGAPLVWAAAKWIKTQANSTTEASTDTLELYISKVIPIYESMVERHSDDPIYQLYFGSAKGLSARISLGEKNWIQTLIRAYSGFSLIEDAYKQNPDLKDALLPFGIVEYYGGISSSFIQWLIDVYGLNPSISAGLNKMEEAAEQSSWAWIEAKGILSFLYLWVENQPSWALKHTTDLVEAFPNNYYFYLLHLESVIRTGNKNESIIILSKNKQMESVLTPRQLSWYKPYALYEKALFEYEFGDLDTSLEYALMVTNDYDAELDIILGNALLHAGKIYDLKNRRNEAISFYNTCIELNNFSASMSIAKKYIQTPFTR